MLLIAVCQSDGLRLKRLTGFLTDSQVAVVLVKRYKIHIHLDGMAETGSKKEKEKKKKKRKEKRRQAVFGEERAQQQP